MDQEKIKELDLKEMEEVSGGAIWTLNDGVHALNEGGIRQIAQKYKTLGLSSKDTVASILEKRGGLWIKDNREQELNKIDCRIRSLVEETFKA